MLKEHTSIFRKLLILADLCLVTLSFCLAYLLRGRVQDILPLSSYIGLLPILLLIWGGLLWFFGMYESFRRSRLLPALSIIFKAAFFGFVIFACYIYLFKLEGTSRSFIILTFVFTSLLLSLKKSILIIIFRHLRKKGYNYKTILIVGTGKRAQYFISQIHKHVEWGIKIIGLVDNDASKTGENISGYKVFGTFDDMPNIIHNNIVDEVIFVVPRSWLNNIETIMHFCEAEGIRVSIAVDYFNLKFSKAKQSSLNGFPLLTYESIPDRLWHLLFKRVIDMVLSATALILLAPFFAVIAAAIKITSEGPVFFSQRRCSLNGRRFTIYKFRTMVKDAEARLESLIQHNEMSGPTFKIENDPRLTCIGKFLRKTSIDELPQLWNVFKGDMSLVGPRPPLPKEVEKYDNWQRRRLSMRPGITCLWQINGRNKIIDFDKWAKLDLEYIDKWSIGLDFMILFKTIPAVLFRKGAK